MSSGKKASGELKLRILSAAVLLPVSLAAIWLGGPVFGALVVVVCVASAMELARMLEARTFGPFVILLVATAIAPTVVFLLAGPEWAFATLALCAIAASIFDMVTRDVLGIGLLSVVYIGLPALALVALRNTDSSGLNAVIVVFVTVWATDIGAYFVGRRIGGRKLAPSISPGKTWSGALGGLVAAVIAGMVLAATVGGTSVLAIGFVAAVLSVAAQLGDLTESALKRHTGVKDSGNLIPGHGGVLDRVDGVLFACVVAYAIGISRAGMWAPGQGVFAW